MKKLALPNIDFADSEFIKFELREDNVLSVYLQSWEENQLIIRFVDTISVFYESGNIVKDIYEIETHLEFLNDAIIKKYVKIPTDHPYRLFYVETLRNYPFLKIVAQSVQVIEQ